MEGAWQENGGRATCAPPPMSPCRGVRSGDRCFLESLRCTRRAMCDGGLAETDADRVETAQIRITQIGEPLPDVVDRLVHPVLLIFLFRLENSAAVNVTEQLVTRSVEQLLVRQITLRESY